MILIKEHTANLENLCQDCGAKLMLMPRDRGVTAAEIQGPDLGMSHVTTEKVWLRMTTFGGEESLEDAMVSFRTLCGAEKQKRMTMRAILSCRARNAHSDDTQITILGREQPKESHSFTRLGE